MTVVQTLPNASANFKRIAQFTRAVAYEDIPSDVTRTAALFILDLIGVLAAGSKLDAGRIARDHAVRHWAAGADAPSARLLFDGRAVSLPGHAFALATQIDNLDAHDGWQPSKGHAGAALFPALCSFAEAEPSLSGRDALAAMVLGYEVAYRAAVALHATVSDYHTSGAWNGLGCVSIGARLRGLEDDTYRHALGIAEYHGPRSQMMREIANPTMLHDGTGFGAPTGVYAVLIAEDGFEGAPAATIEFEDAEPFWGDLGTNWLTAQQYIKPYPICRWAHAAIDAALNLRREFELTPEMIERVDIKTFAYSAELNCGVPQSISMAQYSLAWPVAAALVRGHVGVDEVMETSFSDPGLIAMTERTHAHVEAEFENGFPEQRLASVSIRLTDGRVLDSGSTVASGGPDPQPSETEVIEKFRAYAGTVLDQRRVADIEEAVLSLSRSDADFKALLDLMVDPATP